jgi:acetyltransferase AlgX (SGNH hydrolase-like protein)
MNKLKPVLKVLRQAFVILLITLVLTEIVFRCYNYFRPSFIFYDSSYNRFRGKPNALDYDFRLNSKGFKDVEFSPQKAAGTYRILGLGDSFAYGVVPYQNNYLTLLEERLNNGSGKTEILNMGIPNIGPRDYVALLVNEGLDLKPDMVLVSFFNGNDFSVDRSRRNVYQRSYVASFLYYLFVASRGLQGQIIHGGPYLDNAPSLSDEVFLAMEIDRSYIFRKQDPVFARNLPEALSYLVEMKKICDERHIKLAVLLIPDMEQADSQLQEKVVQGQNASPSDFDFTAPNRLLAAGLKQQNIEVLDLYDAFRLAAPSTVLYKRNDSHWNIAGNKLAAESIATGLFHLAPH